MRKDIGLVALLAQVEPAARAVEETAQALVLAQEEQKSAIRAATEERNAVIKDADRKRRLADEAVARAVDAANVDFDRVSAAAAAAVDEARAAHAKACAVAEPLLADFKERTDHVSAVASGKAR